MTAPAMRKVLAQGQVDLVILDLMLPGEDGLTLARALREESPVGIIILTGRGETVDRIIGLEMGADDYLPKPFHLRELLARVKSVLRRSLGARRRAGPAAAGRSRARFAGWHLDLATPRAGFARGRRGAAHHRRVRSPRRLRQERQPGAEPRPAARSRAQPRGGARSTAPSTCRSGGCAASSSPIRRSRPSSRRCAAPATSSRRPSK